MNLAFKTLSLVLMVVGAGVVLGALLWWQSFYGDLIRDTGYTMRDALPCLYSSSGMCAIVSAASQLVGKAPYDPTVLWIGVALIGAGLLVLVARAGRR